MKWKMKKYKQTEMNTEDLRTLVHRTVLFYTPRPAPSQKNTITDTRTPTDHDIRSQANPERNEK